MTFRAAAGAAAATVIAVATLGGCGSSGSGAGGISVDAVHVAAGKLGSGGGACPLGLDVDAALKAVGVPGTAAPDTASGPAAEGSTPETASDGSVAKEYGFSQISCSYVITAGRTTTELGVRLNAMSSTNDTIVKILAPRIAADGHLGPADMRAFVSTSFGAGQSRVTPGMGTAAYLQLTGSGSGVGLEVGTSVIPDVGTTSPALSGAALEKFITTVGGQVRV